jgi:ubiquitin-conjugating enzyme E2 Q
VTENANKTSQYINLGFGPSLEHEILTQPNVADLLISFCYASVAGRRIREYPNGMSLSVPPVGDNSLTVGPYHTMYPPAAYPPAAYPPATYPPATYPPASYPIAAGSPQLSPSIDGRTTESRGDSYKVRYDPVRQEVILEQDRPCPVRRGDWIVLTTATGK